jgi:glycine/D-amino acid oxidase-like deaminating enzyme
VDGVLAAVGHYRNGILLAPLTAAAVVDLVGRRPVAPRIQALAPA